MSDVRRALHSAYSLVHSVEANKSIASLTLDHMIQGQITRLKKGEKRDLLAGTGEDIGNRTSRYDQLTEIEDQITKAVQAIREAGSDTDKLRSLGIHEVDTKDDGQEAEE